MPLPALIAAAQEIEIKGVFRRHARVRLKKSRGCACSDPGVYPHQPPKLLRQSCRSDLMSHLVDRRDYCREQIVKLISAVWLAEIVSALTIPWIPAEARRGGIRRRSKGAARVDANFLTNF